MTVLLGYNDHCITLKDVLLVTFHYSIIIMNTLACSKNTENISMKLKITHSFIKCLCVSNACKTEFCIFISLGDK